MQRLITLAQRCEALSGQAAPTLPTVTASAWQTTGTATGTVNAGMSSISTACKSRMTADGSKLTQAASAYQNQDDHSARRLSAVGSHLPAGSGVDGGLAGGPPPGITPLDPRAAGGDGGAAGLGTGK